MLTSHFKEHCKTSVQLTIFDLGHALLTHRDAHRMHETHEPHLEGSWVHLGASCWPSWKHLGSCGGLPGPHGSINMHTKQCKFNNLNVQAQKCEDERFACNLKTTIKQV